MLLVLAGCDSGVVNVRALPTPEPEQPPANLPVQLHQRNWTGSLGQGSCVHASLVNHLRWLNRFELGERWRATYADGEWDSRLRDRLDAAGIDYSYTLKADPRFLDWASATRRGAILWWKPQADQQQITDEAFGEGLAGNSIDDATGALLEALINYFPESRRRLLRKAAEKQKLIETRGISAIEKRLDDPNLVDKLVEDLERKLAVPTLNDSSSDLPESSESIQVP